PPPPPSPLSLHDALPIYPDQLGREHLLLVEPPTAFVIEPTDRELLVEQGRVHERRVDVQEQMGVQRVVPRAGDRIDAVDPGVDLDRKSTRLNSSHVSISY